MSFSDPIIRQAGAPDVAALHALIHRAYRGDLAARSWSHEGELPAGERVTMERLSAMTADPTCAVLVAERGGDLIGSVMVEAEAGGRALIHLLSVAPELQEHGLGDRLLLQAEQEAARRFGTEVIVLEVLQHKAKLLSYYERRGYRRTGTTKPYPHRLSKPAWFLVLAKDIRSRAGEQSCSATDAGC